MDSCEAIIQATNIDDTTCEAQSTGRITHWALHQYCGFHQDGFVSTYSELHLLLVKIGQRAISRPKVGAPYMG